MKKKIISLLLCGAILGISLTACGGSNSESNNGSNDSSSTVEPEKEQKEDVATYKKSAIDKLDEIVNPVIASIKDTDIKAAIQQFYDDEKQYVEGITDLDTAKAAANKVVEDAKAFGTNTLKPLVKQKLDAIVNPLIQKITYDDLKTAVQNYYNTSVNKFITAYTIAEVIGVFNQVDTDTKKYIVDETARIVLELKNAALEALDPYVEALINKIPYDTLKTDTQAFYTEEKKSLEAVDTIEGVDPCVNKIKEDLEKYALDEAKKIAISKLDEVVDAGLDKIPNEDLKSDLNDFADKEIKKLNAVTKLEDVPTTLATVTTETTAHIKELLITTVKDYLAKLTKVETATAYDYLPSAMAPSYMAPKIQASDLNYDFTSFTNISSINQVGYGEQWQMVIENINQSVAMAKVFNVCQTALNAAGQAANIYIENSYADEMSYEFSGTGYNGLFEFKNNKLILNIYITSSVTVPVAGSVQPIIKMEYNLTSDYKSLYISLGDLYKIRNVVAANYYEMATTYGVTILGYTGTRTSFLRVARGSVETTGNIYEYTTINGKDIAAAADFYVKNGYVTVVGNKASGMTGFDGYICELYKADEGKLLGYEVMETLSAVTYNTLWFNLWDIDGINSVRVTDKTDANKSGKSTVDVYLNGSTTLLSPTYNTKLGVKTSRKYDIEYRSRFYYTYDSESKTYVAHEVLIPMLFIQEGDNFNSFKEDIEKDNNIDASVSMNQVDLNKLLSDYDNLIPVFEEYKGNVTSSYIINYLKQFE